MHDGFACRETVTTAEGYGGNIIQAACRRPVAVNWPATESNEPLNFGDELDDGRINLRGYLTLVLSAVFLWWAVDARDCSAVGP